MKTLYLDCGMGVSEDMLLGALLELVPASDSIVAQINELGLPGIMLRRRSVVRGGVSGTQLVSDMPKQQESKPVKVRQPESLLDISALIRSLPVSERVRENAVVVFDLLAQAQGRCSGAPVSLVQMRRFGTMDKIACVVGVCMLMEDILPERVVASPVHVGCGVENRDGTLVQIPESIIVDLLRGTPVFGAGVHGELCTPIGAALMRHFASSYGSMPSMTIVDVGYGMGNRDLEGMPYCVRAMLGDQSSPYGPNDRITELSCTIGDMTGEALGFAAKRLTELGASEVQIHHSTTGNGAPALNLVCLVASNLADDLAAEILRNTTTFNVRRTEYSRYILSQSTTPIPTVHGVIHVRSGMGYGIEKMKPDYDDIAHIAEQNGLSMSEVLQELNL